MKIPQENIWNPKQNGIDFFTRYSLLFMPPFFSIINCHHLGLEITVAVAIILSASLCFYYSADIDDNIKKILVLCLWLFGAFFVIISFKWYEYVVYFLPILLWLIKYLIVRHRYK